MLSSWKEATWRGKVGSQIKSWIVEIILLEVGYFYCDRFRTKLVEKVCTLLGEGFRLPLGRILMSLQARKVSWGPQPRSPVPLLGAGGG